LEIGKIIPFLLKLYFAAECGFNPLVLFISSSCPSVAIFRGDLHCQSQLGAKSDEMVFGVVEKDRLDWELATSFLIRIEPLFVDMGFFV
jgi:hypothetical protein